MKKLSFIIITLLPVLQVLAQSRVSFAEGQPVVVYSLPKTVLSIDLETEKITRKPGIYYQYSERYLATNQVITEEKTTYRLKSVLVKANAVPDIKRTFVVPLAKNSIFNRIALTPEGLLCGINVPAIPYKPTVSGEEYTPIANKTDEATLLPLGEEYMLAGSTAKLAEGVAKQIYRLRESRVGLLTGDMEHTPDDVSGMLAGIDKQEKELTSLFVGKTSVDVQKFTLTVSPDSVAANKVLFRLSAFKGLVAPNDLSGNPYYINVTPDFVSSVVPNPKASKPDGALYTIMPASATITIGDGANILYTGKVMLPQYGAMLPVTFESLGNTDAKVSVDPVTGRLLSIEQPASKK